MFENKTLEIMKSLGFENIRRPSELAGTGSVSYDYDAEKKVQKMP